MATNNPMTEEDMVKALSATGRYVVTPASDQKPPSHGRGKLFNMASSSPVRSLFQQPGSEDTRTEKSVRGELSSLLQQTTTALPKIPFFSGEEPAQKGDVTYEEWKYEVNCLLPDYNSAIVIQSIRRSLRGQARRTLMALGNAASVTQILRKMDVKYGETSTKGMIMQQFFNARQEENETLSAFSCRLESLFQVAIEGGHIGESQRNDHLREKFWSSLRCERLQSHTRHIFDNTLDYDDLFLAIRRVEKQLEMQGDRANYVASGQSNQSVTTNKKVCHQPLQSISSSAPMIDKEEIERGYTRMISDVEKRLSDQMATLLQRMDDLQQQLTRSQTTPYYDHPSEHQSHQVNNRGNNRGRYNSRGGRGYDGHLNG